MTMLLMAAKESVGNDTVHTHTYTNLYSTSAHTMAAATSAFAVIYCFCELGVVTAL
jgi:hypothetical protein